MGVEGVALTSMAGSATICCTTACVFCSLSAISTLNNTVPSATFAPKAMLISLTTPAIGLGTSILALADSNNTRGVSTLML